MRVKKSGLSYNYTTTVSKVLAPANENVGRITCQPVLRGQTPFLHKGIINFAAIYSSSRKYVDGYRFAYKVIKNGQSAL